jgi:hypothetical protein
MFLSQSADEVSLLVRGQDLRKMSSYLSERVLANHRIRIRYNTEVAGIEGVEHICGVRIREANGEIKEELTSGLFVFIGAKPRTSFLPASIERNEQGFLLTGQGLRTFLHGKNQDHLALWKRVCPEFSRLATAEAAVPNVLLLRLAMVRRPFHPYTSFSKVCITKAKAEY